MQMQMQYNQHWHFQRLVFLQGQVQVKSSQVTQGKRTDGHLTRNSPKTLVIGCGAYATITSCHLPCHSRMECDIGF